MSPSWGHPDVSHVLELVCKGLRNFLMELLAPHSFFYWGQRGKTSHTGRKKWISAPALPACTRFVCLPQLQGFTLEVTREDTLENGNSGSSPGNFSLVLFTVMKKTRGINEFQSPAPFRPNSMPTVLPYHPSLSHNRTTEGKSCDKVGRNLCHCKHPLKSHLLCVSCPWNWFHHQGFDMGERIPVQAQLNRAHDTFFIPMVSEKSRAKAEKKHKALHQSNWNWIWNLGYATTWHCLLLLRPPAPGGPGRVIVLN